jgi:hypothetical protein
VRLNDEGPLPYALGEYLKPLQYALWQEEKDTIRIAHNILNVMSGEHVLPRQPLKESFDQRAIYELLVDHFNESELRDLCFFLEIEYENLAGSTKLDKARELIAYCDRRDELSRLVAEMDKRRPRLGVSARVIHLSEPATVLRQTSETRTQEGATLVEPLPNFDPRLILEPPTGMVDLESPFYIERHADMQLNRQGRKGGTTTTIRAPRQMGKTSLLVRRVDYARQQGSDTIFLDFQMIDKTYLDDLDVFLFYIARLAATTLNLDPANVTTMWQSPLSPKDRLTLYFEDYVLRQAKGPVILAIDEADRLLESTFYQEFFGLIRAWDTRRGYNASWKKLSVIMVISTQPFLLIEDINQSPFNVGLRIELEDFNIKQIEELNRRHGSPISPGELAEAEAFLGGHPYLVRQALYTLVDQGMTWSDFVQTAADEAGPYSSHLRHYLWQLRDHPELIDSLKRILTGQ